MQHYYTSPDAKKQAKKQKKEEIVEDRDFRFPT